MEPVLVDHARDHGGDLLQERFGSSQRRDIAGDPQHGLHLPLVIQLGCQEEVQAEWPLQAGPFEVELSRFPGLEDLLDPLLPQQAEVFRKAGFPVRPADQRCPSQARDLQAGWIHVGMPVLPVVPHDVVLAVFRQGAEGRLADCQGLGAALAPLPEAPQNEPPAPEDEEGKPQPAQGLPALLPPLGQVVFLGEPRDHDHGGALDPAEGQRPLGSIEGWHRDIGLLAHPRLEDRLEFRGDVQAPHGQPLSFHLLWMADHEAAIAVPQGQGPAGGQIETGDGMMQVLQEHRGDHHARKLAVGSAVAPARDDHPLAGEDPHDRFGDEQSGFGLVSEGNPEGAVPEMGRRIPARVVDDHPALGIGDPDGHGFGQQLLLAADQVLQVRPVQGAPGQLPLQLRHHRLQRLVDAPDGS